MKRALTLLVLLPGYFCGIRAQTYRFYHYTKDNGLPNAYIYSIDQDRNGFLNLASADGFFSFDGKYFNKPKGKNTLPENFITTHFTDSREITWLGFLQEGISCISNTKHNKINYQDIKGYRVTQFIEPEKNRILVSTQGGGIFSIDSLFRIAPFNNSSIRSINTIAFNKGEVLAGTNEGLFVCTANDCRQTGITELQQKRIKKIIPAAFISQAFWVAAEGD